jgi:hypothetical protein
MNYLYSILFTVILSISVISTSFGQAKHYQPLRGDIGMIIARPFGVVGGTGMGGFTEVKFNATDRLSAGFRFEGVILFGGSMIQIVPPVFPSE